MTVPGQFFNHPNLLQILFAKHRKGWLHRLKQQVHHGHHTVEMARATRPFVRMGEGPPMHRRRLGLPAVQLLCRRREHRIRPCRLGLVHVALQRPRIGLEILGVVELGGVDKDGHDHKLGLGFGQPDQAGMPFVQRPHRGHKTGDLLVPPH